MKAICTLLLLFTLKIFSQNIPDLNLEVQSEFLEIPVEANFVSPKGVDINSKGHIFISNSGSKKLMEFDASGKFVKSIGNGILAEPHGLRIDNKDNIWVTDTQLHLVVKFTPNGTLSMILGQSGKEGLYDNDRKTVLFFKPADIAFGKNGDLFVADGYGNSRVVKLDASGNFIKAWGEMGTEVGNFNNPHNIVIDQNDLIYVADRHNNRIQIFDSNGVFKKAWTHLGKPWGLAIIADILYISDGTSEKILKADLEGNILASYTNPGQEPGQFRGAHGIKIHNNNIYLTEVINWRVQKLEIK
jgi:DNA-binding beta-propeller fold protein YncE